MIKNTKDNDQVLSNKDLKTIEEMAKRYGVSVQELGRIIARPKATYPKLQILFTEEELQKVDKNSKKAKVNRSKYCMLCFKKAQEEDYISSINILKVVQDSNKGKRDKRAVISFDGADTFVRMKKVSEEIGLQFSCLVRYFALNVKL